MKVGELLGAVLAGGESRRFGRDKAVEVVGGRTLVQRAAETLAEVFDDVVVVSSRSPGDATTAQWPRVADRRQNQGPLAGIEAALLHAREIGLGGVFVLACDLPLVDAQTVRTVLRARGEAAACAPARASHPGVEPLCAAYGVSCLSAASSALDLGNRPVHEVFAAVGGVTTPIQPDVLLNVNRPEDAERATAALEQLRPPGREADARSGR